MHFAMQSDYDLQGLVSYASLEFPISMREVFWEEGHVMRGGTHAVQTVHGGRRWRPWEMREPYFPLRPS